jgi:hypothetical protein
MAHLWHPRTGTTVFLPHLAAATELLVIDWVAQHDPQPDPQLASCSDSRFTQSLLCQLAPVEALQLWIAAHGVYGCLAPEKPQERVTLLAQPAEPLLTAAIIRISPSFGPSAVTVNTETVYSGRCEAGVVMTSVSD